MVPASSTTPIETTAPATRPRILVVEDEWLIAADFEEALNRAGYDVVGPVATAEDARALIEEVSLAGALLDIHLSDGTSFSLASRLKELRVPYVYVTGYDAQDLPEPIRRHQMVNKPVPDGALERLVAELVGKSAGN